ARGILRVRDELDERAGDVRNALAHDRVELERVVARDPELERVRQLGELALVQFAAAMLEVERQPLVPESLVAFVLGRHRWNGVARRTASRQGHRAPGVCV